MNWRHTTLPNLPCSRRFVSTVMLFVLQYRADLLFRRRRSSLMKIVCCRKSDFLELSVGLCQGRQFQFHIQVQTENRPVWTFVSWLVIVNRPCLQIIVPKALYNCPVYNNNNHHHHNNNNNNAGVFILRRLHPDDNERVITTLWTEANYI